MKYTVLSPDGFPPSPDAEYSSFGAALLALVQFVRRFEAQGYYLTADRERIPLTEIHQRCQIERLL